MLRELSDAEMEMTGGGWGDVVAEGVQEPHNPFQHYPYPFPEYDAPYYGGYQPSYGGGGSTPPPPPQPPTTPFDPGLLPYLGGSIYGPAGGSFF